ncbi:MAG: PGF-CTERM sorting domain-containing protein, partial [Euryarchaeota archaeon]|nr:PGF-CTERM sorting domain-containing protein [Euryarchaeota archaeon]
VYATLTTDGRVAANVSSLSTFGLIGTAITGRSSGGGGGGGGGGGSYPLPTPTVTATPASANTTPDTTATAAKTAAQAATKKPTAKPAAQTAGSVATPDAPEKKGLLPGFEGVFAIAGLLSIAYVVMRRKR